MCYWYWISGALCDPQTQRRTELTSTAGPVSPSLCTDGVVLSRSQSPAPRPCQAGTHCATRGKHLGLCEHLFPQLLGVGDGCFQSLGGVLSNVT